MGSVFYQWPTIWVFILFTLLITLASIIGLYLFNSFGLPNAVCEDNNAVIGIFIAAISVFLGIILSFIIVTVWNNYTDAMLNADKEAETLYLLYVTVKNMPQTERTKQLIIDYIDFIIRIEYPELKQGKRPTDGDKLLTELEIAIYGYLPQSPREVTLYNESINLLNRAIELRTDRLNSAFVGIYPVIWWVAIIDSILIIIMAWFIKCSSVAQYILTGVVGIYVATALFLVIILSYPFEGYLGLGPDPFNAALAQIGSLPSI